MSVTFLSEYSRDPAKAVRRKLEELHRTDTQLRWYARHDKPFRADPLVPSVDSTVVIQPSLTSERKEPA